MAGRSTVSQERPGQDRPAATPAAGAGDDPRAQEATARAARAPDLPPLVGILRPLIDVVASIPVSVHAKLLTGFLISALLLLAMGLLSLAMIEKPVSSFACTLKIGRAHV